MFQSGSLLSLKTVLFRDRRQQSTAISQINTTVYHTRLKKSLSVCFSMNDSDYSRNSYGHILQTNASDVLCKLLYCPCI